MLGAVPESMPDFLLVVFAVLGAIFALLLFAGLILSIFFPEPDKEGEDYVRASDPDGDDDAPIVNESKEETEEAANCSGDYRPRYDLTQEGLPEEQIVGDCIPHSQRDHLVPPGKVQTKDGSFEIRSGDFLYVDENGFFRKSDKPTRHQAVPFSEDDYRAVPITHSEFDPNKEDRIHGVRIPAKPTGVAEAMAHARETYGEQVQNAALSAEAAASPSLKFPYWYHDQTKPWIDPPKRSDPVSHWNQTWGPSASVPLAMEQVYASRGRENEHVNPQCVKLDSTFLPGMKGLSYPKQDNTRFQIIVDSWK